MANYLCFRLGPDAAEDVAAETFARAWAHRADFDPRRGAPSTWLWGIVRHAAADHRRRAPPEPVELPASIPSETDVTREVASADELRRAAAAIARLAPVDQEIIALRFGAGLTNREIAELLGRREGNVALRLHRAFRSVRHLLEHGGQR